MVEWSGVSKYSSVGLNEIEQVIKREITKTSLKRKKALEKLILEPKYVLK